MNILILPNLDKENTFTCIKSIRRIFSSDKHFLMYHNDNSEFLSNYGDCFSDDLEGLLKETDIVFAIGGDGTIIHSAKIAAEAGKPILGINSGYLGFTAGLELEELEKLSELADGNYPVEERLMLDVRVLTSDGTEKLFCHSINDAVVSRGTLSRMIELSVTENDRQALSYRADGLIVSTPTGSTAYALSAGGPAIAPQIKCITVTPICPHNLSSRTIIFGDSSVLSVSIGTQRGNIVSDNPDSEVYLTVDGEIICRLDGSDRVIIKKSDICAKYITLRQQCFSEILRLKFQ